MAVAGFSMAGAWLLPHSEVSLWVEEVPATVVKVAVWLVVGFLP